MSINEESPLNSTGRTTKSIYQQSGEKHVLFYPTTTTMVERKNWCQSATSSNSIGTNLQIVNNDSDQSLRMSKNDGTNTTTTTTATSTLPEPTKTKTTQKSTTQTTSNRNPVRKRCHSGFRFGIFGWRKKCLYILILVLLFMVVVNLALTLWVLKVMDFSSDGMGQLEIVPGGLRLKGKAYILKNLIASKIKSRRGEPIVIESSRNITLKSRNSDGRVVSWIHLDSDRFECSTNRFHVVQNNGPDQPTTPLFSVDRDEVLIGANTLRVSGEGGTCFSGSIQSKLVRAESGHDLRLESPTRSLLIKAPRDLRLESRGGQINSFALNDIAFKSEIGAIHLQSSSIIIPHLTTAKATPSSSSSSSGSSGRRTASSILHPSPRNFDVFQLCACENGKLFLASPYVVCASNKGDGLCR